MESVLLIAAVFGPLAAAAVAIVAGKPDPAGRVLTAGGSVAAIAAAGLIGLTLGEESNPVVRIDWLGLAVTRAGALLLLVVAGTATVVAGFSRRSLDDDGRASRYFALVGVVATGSALVVAPATPALLLVGWVASGWALVGLIGFESSWYPVVPARRRILFTLSIGDVALLAALVVAGARSDGLLSGRTAAAVEELSNSSVGGVTSLHVFAVLLVIAGASRSAMVPFHRWLISTLAAPTPVSALVHAGLVSGAGLLLIRFAGAFVQSDPAVVLAFVLGLATIAVATSAGLLRSDAKGSLAWSTVAQMAFMVVQCAVGAFSSAVFHIAGHGMYKAALFLGAGDTVSDGLRARRRPTAVAPIDPAVRWLVSAAAATVAVGLAVWAIPPDVSDAGRVLVVVFAWLSIAFGLSGWISRGPLAPMTTIAVGMTAGLVSAFAYLAGLRLVEAFVKPTFAEPGIGAGGGPAAGTIIGPTELIIVLAVMALVAGGTAVLPGPAGRSVRRRWYRFIVSVTEPGMIDRLTTLGRPSAGEARSAGAGFPTEHISDTTRRAEIRADISRAGAVIAPQWPLASFVAVNPLGGLEAEGFDVAADSARRWLGARTHLTLAEYRRDHAAGLSTAEDLEFVAHYRFTEICEQDPVTIGGRPVSPVELIVADLLHGPEAPSNGRPATQLGRYGPPAEEITALIDDVLAAWIAAYLDPPKWSLNRPGERFTALCRRLMLDDPRIAPLLDGASEAWITGMHNDPAAMIDAAFEVSGVADPERPDELRAHLCRLPGWAGLAKWRNEWAQPDESLPPLAPIDLAAVRAVLEALAIGSGAVEGSPASRHRPVDDDLDARVEAVARLLSPSATDADRADIAAVLAEVPTESRASMWLRAQERNLDQRLLSMLDRVDPGPTVAGPDAQLVFCIDVRSEGLRRHIETVSGANVIGTADATSAGNTIDTATIGTVETIGFAGFFGVPMKIRRLGWDHTEPRCPVLVAPAIEANEHPRTDAIGSVSNNLSRQRTVAGLHAAHSGAKHGPGGPFALAETMGWALGPEAALRTFLPGRYSRPNVSDTRMLFDDDEVLLEQRVFFAEAVLNTMGLTDRFAPIVVLCGHTSETTNNPHATALECGACAGAAGDDNARAVAALLNSPDIRHGLAERGITIPDETHFLAGLHDTPSDTVTLLDTADAPPEHRNGIERLRVLLEEAGRRQAEDRATHLPGPAATVRDRGADWAQIRPEWGLARNAAFIIGPRPMTAGLDLEGRAFLHSYNADNDPTGRVLETIMTAPLVVGHWISSQYYFSTVDPEAFGAGNKLLHNPIGTTGVISGDRGDLRVGLPLQSTHIDGRRFHQPVRLLAVIQADLERIETIIAANPVLQTLIGGSWLRVAARSHPHERWSTRTPEGTWVTNPRPLEQQPTLTPDLEIT